MSLKADSSCNHPFETLKEGATKRKDFHEKGSLVEMLRSRIGMQEMQSHKYKKKIQNNQGMRHEFLFCKMYNL